MDLTRENTRTINIINTVLSSYTSSNSTYESLNKLLNFIIEFTNSEFGFIGEVLSESNGDRYLKSHALTNISWNKETLDLYTKNVATGLTFKNNNTLFGVVLKTGEAYISNEPASDPHSGGTPHGHPTLLSFMGIPIYNQDQFIGMVGLANNKEGYTQNNINSLSPLLPTITTILHSFKTNKLAEESKKNLNEKEKNLIAIITSIEDEVIEINENYEILNYWTSAKMQINPNLLKNVFELFPHVSAEEIQIYIDAILKDGKKRTYEYKIENKWVGLTFSINPLGSDRTVIILVQNISKRKKAELNLIQKIEQEKALIKTRAEFLNIASHELKSPMASLQTTIDLVHHKIEIIPNLGIDGIQKHLHVISSEVQRASKSIHDILEIGKLDANAIPIINEEVVIPQVICPILEKYQAIYPNANIKFDLNGDVKPLIADRGILEIALNNVISNAFKYSKQDIEIAIGVTQMENQLEIMVSDKGIGISEENLAKLFTPFFRAANHYAEGTGLGLIILKQCLSKLKGQIEIQSELNVGTCVKLTFNAP